MAPVAVRVLEPPVQMVDGEAVADTLGSDPTVTVTEAEREHPFAFVPVTE